MIPVLQQWQRLSRYPGGKRLFSLLIGRFARYTGTIGARVRELEPGRSVVTMRDRPKVRNHLRSIHATALVTFGEMASGLAMVAGMPAGARSIVTRVDAEYFRKARGRLTALGSAPIPPSNERQTYLATASIRDESDEEVARVTVHWLVGPAEERGGK